MNGSVNIGNRRILVIDDTPSIHQDFRKILGARLDSEATLASAEAALFGDAPTVLRQTFELDSAYQGQEALALVMSAVEQNRPYAMAFIDMRMPPGWDGVETIERLWQVDSLLQVALCTAHSDYSWEEMTERLELGDRLLILKKPFDAIEIRQMASALTVKWQMTQDAALKMNALEQAVEERTRELSDANIIVQNSPTILYRL
ncbi:MAG: response regulator, partial [Xanthobacteraceae bacterium]|nr:response regulator [Xanthobacteraceae bacterium]